MNAHQRRLKRRQEWRSGTAKATMRTKEGRVIELEQIWRPKPVGQKIELPVVTDRTWNTAIELGWKPLAILEAIRKATQP